MKSHKNIEQRDDVFKMECESTTKDESKWTTALKNLRVLVLVLIWVVCSYVLMVKNEKMQEVHQLSVPEQGLTDYYVREEVTDDGLWISLQGALLPPFYANLSSRWLDVWVQRVVTMEDPSVRNIHITPSSIVEVQNVSEIWRVPVVSEKLIGRVPEVKQKKLFSFNTSGWDNEYYLVLARIRLSSKLRTNFPVSIEYNLQKIKVNHGVIYAALVLLGLYILIIFEIVHRTLAAMLSSTISVAILAALDDRPTMAEVVSWIGIDTLLLLFSMMVIVTLLSETGVFEYMSVLAYKITGGKVWPMIGTLCFFTAIVSCFLDNVTTVLLMTPVTIRLCEVMKLNPVTVLTSMVIYSNLGGAVTPIGDPPNVIIQSNPSVLKAGINFGTFTLHMGTGVVLVAVILYFQLKIMYRNNDSLRYLEPEIQREIAAWKRTAASVGSYSKEEEAIKETLTEKAKTLIQTQLSRGSELEQTYEDNLRDLEVQYPIRNKSMLIKCSLVLLLIVGVFSLNSIPEMNKLGIGWTALLGVFLLLLLTERDDIDPILARVEWSTLLFFASLFILMEALSKMGLIEWIGTQTQSVIMSVDHENRLTVAILLILWVSAAASAFVDNIPLTTMMVRVATTLVENRELGLPLQPLIWALSFGACFGGNGSLFGSSSNIVCAGVAEQHGYRFSFVQFLKIGFPVMITSMMVITVYLLVCHVVLAWH